MVAFKLVQFKAGLFLDSSLVTEPCVLEVNIFCCCSLEKCHRSIVLARDWLKFSPGQGSPALSSGFCRGHLNAACVPQLMAQPLEVLKWGPGANL